MLVVVLCFLFIAFTCMNFSVIIKNIIGFVLRKLDYQWAGQIFFRDKKRIYDFSTILLLFMAHDMLVRFFFNSFFG